MNEPRVTVREVAWSEVVPGALLLKPLRLAAQLPSLLVAAIGILLTTAGWKILGGMLLSKEGIGEMLPSGGPAATLWPWEASGPLARGLENGLAQFSVSPIDSVWRDLSSAGTMLFDPQTSLGGFTYLLLCLLWSLVVWSLCGGILTRTAALALTRDEQTTTGDAVAYVRPRWMEYGIAVMMPLLGTLLVAIPLAILGLLFRFSLGAVLAGILYPLVIVAGLFMAMLMIGLLFGWPLMIATVSVEGTDAFGALSSSYAYLHAAPVRSAVYALVASLLGTLGTLIVGWIVSGALTLADWGVRIGAGAAQFQHLTADADLHGLEWAGGNLIRFWRGLLLVVAVAYMYSYFWHAVTAIYLLLRQSVDRTELHEVYLPDEPARTGIPPAETVTVPPAPPSITPDG
jgi:hypothetical protein